MILIMIIITAPISWETEDGSLKDCLVSGGQTRCLPFCSESRSAPWKPKSGLLPLTKWMSVNKMKREFSIQNSVKVKF